MADKENIGGQSHGELIKRQDYTLLWESCIKKKTLFKDDIFPHESHGSYFTEGKLAGKQIDWLRPFSISKTPHFFEGTASRFDVAQGKLNDCWFLSSVADLTLRPKLFAKVVPKQSFHDEYAGIFRFHFYQYGEWMTVVIDDFLPTHKGNLVLGHSAHKDEFWLALLEKAYAKLKGGFQSLNFGNSCEAFVDFTGGVAEIFKFNKPEEVSPNFFNVLYRYYLRDSLICIYIDRPGPTETKLDNGLIAKHAYSLTGMNHIEYKGKHEQLLRLRNPWGKVEWTGAWSDNSPEWNSVSKEEKKKIKLNSANDGEFWITYKDFIEHFNVFECCHVVKMDSNEDSSEAYKWDFFEQMGDWKGSSAGGCVNHKSTFPHNPKYMLCLVDEDIEDEDANDHHCTIIISLIQKFYRYRKAVRNEYIRIGFIIYHFDELDAQSKEKGNVLEEVKDGQVDANFFNDNRSVGRVDFVERRSVSGRFRLCPGKYLIVPSTFEPKKEASFMLRLLISKSNEDRETFMSKHTHHIKDCSQAGSADDSGAHKSHNGDPSHGKGSLTVNDPPVAGTNFKLAHTLEPFKMKVEKKKTTPNSKSSKKSTTPSSQSSKKGTHQLANRARK